MAAEATRKGLAGTIQGAILRILSLLLAIVEEFRAGRLAPMAPVAEPSGADVNGASAERCTGLRRGSGASERRQHSEIHACGRDRRIIPRIKSGGGDDVYELDVEDGEAGVASGSEEFGGECEAATRTPEDIRPGVYPSLSPFAGPPAYPTPTRIGPHFCQQKCEPVAGPSLSLKGRGELTLCRFATTIAKAAEGAFF